MTNTSIQSISISSLSFGQISSYHSIIFINCLWAVESSSTQLPSWYSLQTQIVSFSSSINSNGKFFQYFYFTSTIHRNYLNFHKNSTKYLDFSFFGEKNLRKSISTENWKILNRENKTTTVQNVYLFSVKWKTDNFNWFYLLIENFKSDFVSNSCACDWLWFVWWKDGTFSGCWFGGNNTLWIILNKTLWNLSGKLTKGKQHQFHEHWFKSIR